jgi:hypothetical protein
MIGIVDFRLLAQLVRGFFMVGLAAPIRYTLMRPWVVIFFFSPHFHSQAHVYFFFFFFLARVR